MIKNFILFCIYMVRNYWHQPRIQRSLGKLKIINAFDVGAHKGETIDYLIRLKNPGIEKFISKLRK